MNILTISALILILANSCSKEAAQSEVEVDKKDSIFADSSNKTLSTYDNAVMANNPVGYWMLIKGYVSDASGHSLTGTYYGGSRGLANLPNLETASVFNGIDNYFQINDNDYLEVTRTELHP